MDNSLHAEVFVQIGPMNAIAFADQFPVISFFGRSIQQTGIPDKWGRNAASVRKVDCQRRAGDLDVLNAD